MRIDAYTKAVLTVIALCLVWICISGRFSTPVSAIAPQEVVLVGVRGERTVVPVRPTDEWYDTALPIDAARPLPTRLMAIERGAGARWDPMEVNVREQPRKANPGH